MKENELRVLLSAFIGSHNLGDEAIAKVLIDKLESVPSVELTVLSIDTEKTSKLSKSRSTEVKQVGFLNFVRSLRKCDCLVLGGGGIIQDESSINTIIYYYMQMFIARGLFRKPIFWAFVGVGPIKTKLGSRLLSAMRRLTEYALVRDDESAKLLEAHGFTAEQIIVAYDLVFNFPLAPSEIAKYPGKYLLFCPRDWFFVATVTPTKYALKRAQSDSHSRLYVFRRNLLGLVEKCLQDNPDLVVVGVAFFHTQDLSLLEWIGEKLDPRYAPRYKIEMEELRPEEFLSLAQNAAAVLGVRLHSLILGAVAGRPLIPLVYSAKVGSLVKYLGLNDFTVDLDKPDFSIATVAKNVRHAISGPTRSAEHMLDVARRDNDIAFDELLDHMQEIAS